MALHCAAPAAGAILPAQHGRAPVVPCATPLAPANPLRGQLSRSLRRFRVAERRAPLRGQGVVALALPPLLPVVARVVISFALFYTSMQVGALRAKATLKSLHLLPSNAWRQTGALTFGPRSPSPWTQRSSTYNTATDSASRPHRPTHPLWAPPPPPSNPDPPAPHLRSGWPTTGPAGI